MEASGRPNTNLNGTVLFTGFLLGIGWGDFPGEGKYFPSDYAKGNQFTVNLLRCEYAALRLLVAQKLLRPRQ